VVLGQQITIYNDTYNANPQSMKAGLTTLSNTIGETKVAVLGDMFELGDLEEELHRGVGAVAASLYRGNVNPVQGIDILVTVGERAKYIADEAKKGGFAEIHAFDDVESAKPYLEQVTKANTVLYFKASHSMHLDQLAEFCKGIAE
jgi:UDP-N-acetylmuramoyl-tripeptide--D-alanyl-D-alanine ligase